MFLDGFGELFCMECYSEYKVNENSKRFIYPEGGYVYVRVVGVFAAVMTLTYRFSKKTKATSRRMWLRSDRRLPT